MSHQELQMLTPCHAPTVCILARGICKSLLWDTGCQSLNAGKGERDAELDGGAAASLRGNVDGTLEAIEDGSNDVHADATTGNFGYFGSGAESGFENKAQ